MFIKLTHEQECEVTCHSLLEAYDNITASRLDEEEELDLLNALKVVLFFYMPEQDYNSWLSRVENWERHTEE